VQGRTGWVRRQAGRWRTHWCTHWCTVGLRWGVLSCLHRSVQQREEEVRGRNLEHRGRARSSGPPPAALPWLPPARAGPRRPLALLLPLLLLLLGVLLLGLRLLGYLLLLKRQGVALSLARVGGSPGCWRVGGTRRECLAQCGGACGCARGGHRRSSSVRSKCC